MTALEKARTQTPCLSGVRGACKNYTSLVVMAPSADFEVRRDQYTLRVALPGVQRHTIGVRIKDNTLVVSGAWEGRGEGSTVVFGTVYRAAFLPADAVPAQLDVSLKFGAFTVSVPRRPSP